MINIRFHNTLTGKKEPFRPLENGKVKMYVCGITPYDASHLGHARCYVFFDTVRRVFRACGYEVYYVQNFTDVDDKIIAQAQKAGKTAQVIAERFISDYLDRMADLNVLKADLYPRVTESMPDIVRYIEKLVESGYAYPKGGDVFYRVRNFKNYGKLSKRSLEEMISGARVQVNEVKDDPLDFALWKAAKEGEPSWDSPWGPGRPGWHIECSVMSTKFLGETFDIHGGGQDLIFPHHENEIAQSEAASGKLFANYWLHNGFVTVNREKMSKSLGNFFTLGEIFAKFPPEVVRFFLLSRHYKTPLDFSDDVLEQAKSGFAGLREIIETCFFLYGDDDGGSGIDEQRKKEFLEVLADDFNTEKAIAVLFELRSLMAQAIKKKDAATLKSGWRTLRHLSEDILGISLKPKMDLGVVQKMKAMLSDREAARKAKDWTRADALRKDIEEKGFQVEDTPLGTIIKTLG
ncbi:MAG: cysteine--tRNA ligase [Elusimicrobia bacterium RIFCSPLOWO2_01_FULL_54_10]|nr:MAG: cysteine--tRNA ligase [Elusimicrobia bacterium RIFCSPLOWO2_01_FULL_54_10]